VCVCIACVLVWHTQYRNVGGPHDSQTVRQSDKAQDSKEREREREAHGRNIRDMTHTTVVRSHHTTPHIPHTTHGRQHTTVVIPHTDQRHTQRDTRRPHTQHTVMNTRNSDVHLASAAGGTGKNI
jgi:hypothetical protein